MLFEWDEEKRGLNLEKHGLDFVDGRHLFDGRPVYSYPSPRDGEQRIVTVGMVEHRFVALVWMEREGACRIISFRSARDAERKKYQALLG